jgi:hypothetical protein
MHFALFLLVELLVDDGQVGMGNRKHALLDSLGVVHLDYFLEIVQTFGVLLRTKRQHRHVV